MKKGDYKLKEFIKLNKRYIVLFLLFFISFSGIIYFSSPNINLQSREYEFDISWNGAYTPPTPLAYINNLAFLYDFAESKGNGSFSFNIYNEKDMNDFRISFPKEIEISSINITSENNGNNFCLIINNNSHLYCRSLKGKEKYTFLVLLKEKESESFLPNGVFYIRTPLIETYSARDLESHSGNLLLFNLGSKYMCSEKCVTFEMGANLTYNANKNYFKIYPELKENDKTGSFNRFVINMYNYEKEKIYGIFLAFSISILAGVIVAFLDNKNVIKKQKRIKQRKPLKTLNSKY